MTDDEQELEARAVVLRRVVYGTPDGYESDAATELASIERELSARRAAHDGAESITRPGASVADEADSSSAPDVSVAPARSAGRLATFAAFAAVLAVAAVLGASAAVGVSQAPRGLAVFDRPQQSSDESLTVVLGSQADTVRNLGVLFGRGFWAYRNGDDRVCLSVVPIGSGTVERGECASTSRFEEHGIAVQYSVAELGPHRPDGSRDTDVVQVSWRPDAAELQWAILPVGP